MKKTVDEFLKVQECLFIKVTKDNKVYFCEYMPTTVMWYGKPIDAGITFKRTCIVTELDETTVIDYSADTLFEDRLYTDDWAIAAWEEAHGVKWIDYVDKEAREEWKLACEEE